MRIAVLGAGRQGIVCAEDILRAEDVSELRMLDADPASLAAASDLIRDPRLRVVETDAADEAALPGRSRGAPAS